MNPNPSDRLRTVQVIETRSAAGLQVFGLRWEVDGGMPYRTLDESLAAGLLEVGEISQGGSVPLLKVTNRGDLPAFLMAGEQLVGAKQNRILNTSLLVPAQSELTVPVSCVEAGRWGYRSSTFTSAGTLSHGQLRKLLSTQTFDSYARGGWPASQQGEVWEEVSRKLGCMRSVSPSRALQQAYEDHQARLHDLLGSLGVSAACHGAAFVIAGRVAGLDLFDRPATLTKLWPKVARAYAIDALEQPPLPALPPRVGEGGVGAPISVELLGQWLRSAADAAAQSYKSPGLGYDVRLKGVGVIGGVLVVEDRPVHAELFTV
jgi:hypothetical protein